MTRIGGSSRRSIRAAGVLAALLIAGTPAMSHAAVILDQSNLGPFTGSAGGSQAIVGGTYFGEAAQTFTVGVNGILDHIDVVIGLQTITGPVTQPLTMTIEGVSGGVPNANALASASLAGASLVASPNFNTFDLSGAGLAVTAGEVLSFVLTSNAVVGANPYSIVGASASPYTGGDAYVRNMFDSNWNQDNMESNPTAGGVDMLFRTYVDASVTSVPEPSPLLIFLAALPLIAVLRRRAS